MSEAGGDSPGWRGSLVVSVQVERHFKDALSTALCRFPEQRVSLWSTAEASDRSRCLREAPVDQQQAPVPVGFPEGLGESSSLPLGCPRSHI